MIATLLRDDPGDEIIIFEPFYEITARMRTSAPLRAGSCVFILRLDV